MNTNSTPTNSYKRFTAESFPLLLDEDTGRLVHLPDGYWLEGFAEPSEYVPNQNPNYVFRKGLFRDITNFLMRPYGHALWLTGPTGSGKTSIVLEVAARLNWGVQSVTCNSRMEFDDLVGRMQIVAVPGETSPRCQFVYGSLARAMKFGHIFILNEVDLADPGQLSGFNDILEGRTLTVTGNGGEVITPHPKFRVVVTANSRGAGDDTGAYCGVQTQNIAALDRYRVLEVDYLPNQVEENLLKKVFKNSIAEEIVAGMVKVANDIRSAFNGTGKYQLSSTMSTRTLVFWGNLLQEYKLAPNNLKISLKLAFASRLTPEEQMAVYSIAGAVFGGNTDWLSTKV